MQVNINTMKNAFTVCIARPQKPEEMETEREMSFHPTRL